MVNERLEAELSATARQIIADARGADDPTAEDEARVKARWLAGIAAGAGVSSLSEAVRAAAGSGWGLKAAAMLAAATAASVGVYLGWPEGKHDTPAPAGVVVSQPPAPARVVAPEAVAPEAVAPDQPQPAQPQLVAPLGEPAVPTEPVIAAQPALPELSAEVAANPAAAEPPAAAQPPAPGVTPPRAVRARRVAAERGLPGNSPAVQAVAAAPIGGQLGEEIALLSQIRGTLQDGAAGRALEQLSQYRRRFEHPSLAMEADALRVDALCSAGQRDAAQAAAAAFTTNWPGSPLQQRVSSACP